ncbi:hypothetical protein MAR_032679 [Mya arenaria]|uniref:Uncharacterized protein n=1 Tax=Mya arenaria TaxID=6604 RepID=A0ABY7F809_MYAAR|nr:hypothetical protein MAR_032679 [Mya arenaria]
MKGAVLMRLKPRDIIQRRSRFTYGVYSNPLFVEGTHQMKFKRFRDERYISMGVFDKLIESGQLLQHKQEFAWEFFYTFKHPDDKQILDPRSCLLEEDQCEEVGRITIPPPFGGWPDVINGEQKLVVGETEFTMKVFIEETNQEYEVEIDFL